MEADIKKGKGVDVMEGPDVVLHKMLQAKLRALQGVKDTYYQHCDLWEDVAGRLQDDFKLMTKSKYEAISYRERSRLLQCECELIERAILKICDPGSIKDAMDLLMTYWTSNLNFSPPEYGTWLAARHSAEYNLPTRFSDGFIPKITYRCPKETCYHYIFGFPRGEELRTHLAVYHSVSTMEFRSTIQLKEASPTSDSTASPEILPRRDSAENLRFVAHEFPHGEPKRRRAPGQSPRCIAGQSSRCSKNKRSDKPGDKFSKPQRVSDPCLRCRLLKKQCDEQTPCKQCPRQDCGAKSDYWKVLGCYRRPLKNIGEVLLSESFRLSFGPIDDEEWPSIDFKRFWFIWLNHHLHAMSRSPPRVSALTWEDQCTVDYERCYLASISIEFPALDSYRSWTSVTIYQLQIANEETSAVSSVLSAYELLHSVYVLRTLKDEIHMISLAFLLLYYKRNKCMPGYCSAFLGVDQTIPYLYRLLESSLEITFDDRCARRKDLPSCLWVHTFVKLCMLGILKSILVDAYTAAGNCDDEATAHVVTSIESAYKALVSMFAWASSPDMLLQRALTVDRAEIPFDADQQASAFQGIYQAVQREKWEERGVKSSKDFLMGLGSGFYQDGTYKGFYVQNYGLKASARTT